MNDETTPGALGSNAVLGPLLAEWAGATCVRFVSRSHGQRTTDTVSRDDLMHLMRAVQAAERERWAKEVSLLAQLAWAAADQPYAAEVKMQHEAVAAAMESLAGDMRA